MCRSTFRIARNFGQRDTACRTHPLASSLLTQAFPRPRQYSQTWCGYHRDPRGPLSLFLRLRVSVASSFQPRLRMNSFPIKVSSSEGLRPVAKPPFQSAHITQSLQDPFRQFLIGYPKEIHASLIESSCAKRSLRTAISGWTRSSLSTGR